MSKINVLIKWNNSRAQWDMYNLKTKEFIQEFFPCRNFSSFFKNIDKSKDNKYRITMEAIP